MKENHPTPMEIASQSLPAFFEEIRKRPAMWFGKKSLVRFRAAMDGFIFAEDIYKIPEEKKLSGFDWLDFEKWVEEKYNHERLTVRSFYFAEQMASSDHEALDKWFEIYDLYMKENREQENGE